MYVELKEYEKKEKESKATAREIVLTTSIVFLTMFSLCVFCGLLMLIAKKMSL